MAKKDKDERFTCVICGDEVKRIKSWQYEDGLACRTHSEAQEAHAVATAPPAAPQPRVAAPESVSVVAEASVKQFGPARADRPTSAAIVEMLQGRPRGTKACITFDDSPDGVAAVAYLVLMKDQIVRMDERTFVDLYAVGVSQQWDHIQRTVEVTLNIETEDDLRSWFAQRLGSGVARMEVVS